MSAHDLRIVAGGPERRPDVAAEIAARTGPDDATIERLVRNFYGRAARDPLIGPIFEAHVEDWEAPIARLCDVWSSVVLLTGRTKGTPMRVHMTLPLDAAAFDRWLELFVEAAREVCPAPAADHVIERARRIASSLEIGAATERGAILPPRG